MNALTHTVVSRALAQISLTYAYILVAADVWVINHTATTFAYPEYYGISISKLKFVDIPFWVCDKV